MPLSTLVDRVAVVSAVLIAAVTLSSREQDPLRAAMTSPGAPPAHAVWLDSLDLSKMVQRRQTPRAGQTLARGRGRGAGAGAGAGTAGAATPITLGGVAYPHGIGTLSINELIVDLKGQATRFVSMVGLDDLAAGEASVGVEVWVDHRRMFASGVMHPGDPPRFVDLDLTGARFLELWIDDGGDTSNGDYADWGGGLIALRADATAQPESWTFPTEAPPPLASGWPAAPRINAPRITGGTPGRPFLFRIPATGDAPLTFAARNLPPGLTLDASTGIITGQLAREGRTDVALTASNARGRATGTLTIVGGADALALTPPLGWNSWNVWGATVDDAKVRAAADAMIAIGLAAHGYQFINIDDGWEGARDTNGVLQPNAKFPDMKALTDYVHSKGLKVGIYSSPGPRTCQGLPGSQGHEDIDARTWADWGFDLREVRLVLVRRPPIRRSRSPICRSRSSSCTRRWRRFARDIVFSLCQYGMGKVWEWGADVGGNLLADDRRPDGRLVEHGGRRLPPGRQGPPVEARPLDRPGHARRRQGRLGPEHSRHAADAQ